MTIYFKREFRKTFTDNKQPYLLVATAKIESHSGQNPYFSLTGDVYSGTVAHECYLDRCGCVHDDIAKHLPNLKPYLKWHLTAINSGPMHYLTNTLYHAGNLDYNGLQKGDVHLYKNIVVFPSLYHKEEISNGYKFEFLQSQWELGNELVLCNGKTKGWLSLQGFPYETGLWLSETAAVSFVNKWNAMVHVDGGIEFTKEPWTYSEGKERDFDAARSTAVWPDATDEELSLPKWELELLLEKRFPQLMEEFYGDMEILFGEPVVKSK